MGRTPARRIAQPLARFARPLRDLTADPANLRRHGERSLAAIAASLERFGQQKPVVADAAGVVIAGHGVLEAARRLGWKSVAVVRSSLSGGERTAYAIADNRAGELSGWDQEHLAETVAAMDPSLALAAGFGPEDLEALRRDAAPDQATEDSPPRMLATPVTRTGDLWALGEHRLLCGDSTDAADVDRLVGNDHPSLVATDPPYLVDYTGERVGGHGRDWSEQYREVEIQDAPGFFHAVFGHVARITREGAAVYCWHAHKRIGEILAAWQAHGILDHQQIVWVKPVPVFGSSFWHFRHEPCLMGWKQGSKPRHDGRHHEDSVWLAPGAETQLEKLPRSELLRLLKEASSVWECGWDGSSRPRGNEHPTQKPVELFARPMRKHTAAGDVCYEPFSGSGTQILAAEQLGRRCLAMELEPSFVDLAVRRWQKASGRDAVLAGKGKAKKSWRQVAKARGVALEERSA